MERKPKRVDLNGNSLELRNLNKRVLQEIRRDMRRYNTGKIDRRLRRIKNMKVLRQQLADGKRRNNEHKIIEITEQFHEEV